MQKAGRRLDRDARDGLPIAWLDFSSLHDNSSFPASNLMPGPAAPRATIIGVVLNARQREPVTRQTAAPLPDGCRILMPSKIPARGFSIMDPKNHVEKRAHRRTTRVLLSVPIMVSGTGEDGQAFEEKTITVTIDGNGAQIVLKNSFPPGARLSITNLRSGKTCPFRLVRRISKPPRAEGEWGVECLQPEANFWGIYFPAKPSLPMPPETEIIEAWLECQRCGSQEMAQLTPDDYKSLGKQPYLSRECVQCGSSTSWGYSYIEAEEAMVVNAELLAEPAISSGKEKRRARRLTLKLPVRIRLADGREEVAGTENLSKIGLCLISGAEMKEGERIRLVFGYTVPGSGTEVMGKVVRRQELAGTQRAIYGVRLEGRP